MKADAFKPQGKQITVRSVGGAPDSMIGQHFRMGGAQQMQAPPIDVRQGGDRFVPVGGNGALPLATQPAIQQQAVPQRQQPRAFQPAAQQQSVQEQLASRQQLAAQQQQQQLGAARLDDGGETFAVYIDGVGPDGAPFSTDAIAVRFPAGSQLSGMRYEKV